MRAATLSAAQIFRSGRFEVPVFQGAYKWATDDRWVELWEAVRDRALVRLQGHPTAPFFLGSIVLDTYPATPAASARREIVDGQHRLTTLQLALVAARDVSRELRCIGCAALFEKLIHDVGSGWRLRSNRANQELFSAVMHAGSPDRVAGLQPAGYLGRGITGGYLYFHAEFRRWLGSLAPGSFADALRALHATLEQDVQFFVLDLERNLLWRVLYGLFSNLIWPERRRAPALGG